MAKKQTGHHPSKTTYPSKAKGRIKRPGVMNRLETRYSEFLEERRVRGEIIRWDYEPVKLRLAKGTYYSPDFRVQISATGEIEYHEVKGCWKKYPASRVKFKVAAETHALYRFVGVEWRDKAWKYEYFND